VIDVRHYVGIDVGKEQHWAVVIDAEGSELLSRRVCNDEPDLRLLAREVEELGGEALWALDMASGPAALALALLAERDAAVVYLPGHAVKASRRAFAGESKSDRIDARLIAENARLRRDLAPLRATGPDPALRTLAAWRDDLVGERTRKLNRLRELLTAVSPALERALDVRRRGVLLLLRRWQTPAQLRRLGERRLAAALHRAGAYRSARLAAAALAAARSQQLILPGEGANARRIAALADELLALRDEVKALEHEMTDLYRARPEAAIVLSLPGFGVALGARLACLVGEGERFASASRLAAYAGLAPVSCDSGKRSGVRHRARGGNRALKGVFYQAAFASLRHPASRAYYDRKRSEGKKHHQALLALARRRISVLYAMLRDGTLYDPSLSSA
jgi:transposase